jgi:hypothetical protein
MKRWKQFVMAFALVLGVGAVALPAASVSAINVFDQCKNNKASEVCKAKDDTIGPMIQIVINILLYILGMVAVIMIVIGGIRYTTSNGDSSAIKSAKDTILYAVVGLIVAILAYSIVNFVVSWF